MSKIVCICGSTRFKNQIMQKAKDLTLEGWIVLMPHVFGHADKIKLSEEQKQALDVLHEEKIKMADCVVVVTVDQYFGKSIQEEIRFAERMGLPVQLCNYSSYK